MSLKHSYLVAAFVALGVTFSGCGAIDGPQDADDAALTADEGKVDSSSNTSTFFKFRHDFRRCISPICGGMWFSRVNFSLTKCVDGSWQSECYVAEVDRHLLGTGTDVDRATIYRGTIKPKTFGTFGTLGVFIATEAYASATEAAPTGTFYRVTDSGIRCVRAPCPSIHEAKLNSTTAGNVTDLNFRAVGATTTQIEAASAALSHGGFLAAGSNRSADGGTTLTMTQFYLRARGATSPVVTPLTCNVDADCVATAYSRTVAAPSDCYCARCPYVAMSRAASAANEASWGRSCGSSVLRCPAIACIRPPEVACVSNQCVAKPF